MPWIMKIIDERETHKKKSKTKQTNKERQQRTKGDRSYSERVKAK